MTSRTRIRKTDFITAYVFAVLILFSVRQLASNRLSPASAPVSNTLIFISDTDSIDAGRQSNSVYRISADGSGAGVDTHPSMKRLVGSIPHGAGYLRITDIDCDRVSQQLVIASHRRDLNGFHHAMLDGSGLHLDRPAAGDLLSATRQIAIAPDGTGILISRQDQAFAEPRFSLVGGDLFIRHFSILKLATSTLSYHSPDWSPDGRRIVYIIIERAADPRPSYRLAVAAPDGSDERIVYETTLALADVAWSPDGRWLALEMSRQIYKLRSDGSGLTRLSSHSAAFPRWSPDGERISFVAPSSFSGFNQLITMGADGGSIKQVVNIRGDVVNGCWV